MTALRWVSVATPPPRHEWGKRFVVRTKHVGLDSDWYEARFDGKEWFRYDDECRARHQVHPTEWLVGLDDEQVERQEVLRWVSVATPPPESLWAWNDSFIVRDTPSSVAYVANFDGTGWSRWDESRYEVEPTEWLAGVNDAWFIKRRLAMFAYAIQVKRFANEQGVDVDVHESGRRLTVEVRFASSPEKITLCSLEHEDGFPVELWRGSQPPVRCESIEGVDEALAEFLRQSELQKQLENARVWWMTCGSK